MIRDVHSAIQDFKKFREIGLELELEFPEVGFYKAMEELTKKFNSLIMNVHIEQETKRIKEDLML